MPSLGAKTAEPRVRIGGTAVRWTDRGFGFITPASGGKDVFVHKSAIRVRSLVSGEPVEYDVAEEASGRVKAVDVRGAPRSDGGGGRDGARPGGRR